MLIKCLILYVFVHVVIGNGKQGQHYYYYQGNLALAVPEISSQYAGLRIEADVIIQMKTEIRGIAQLSNVNVATFNDEEYCFEPFYPGKSVPFGPLVQYKEKFEKPFAINMDPKADVKMLVDEDEEEFITNIRKSIMNLVQLQPIKEVYQNKSSDQHYHNLVQEEDTLYGRCPVHYLFGPQSFSMGPSKQRTSDLSAMLENIMLEKPLLKMSFDPSDNGHELLDSYIDFDKCQYPVGVQRSSLGNLTGSTKSMFKSVLSRLSSQNALFNFSDNKEDEILIARQKRGQITLNPFGFQTEKLQVRTFQFVFGGGMGPIVRPLRLPPKTKAIKTGLFQVASSYPAPSDAKPWINYYNNSENLYPISELFMTGVKASDYLRDTAAATIIKLIEKSVNSLLKDPIVEAHPILHEENDNGLSDLVQATKLMKILPQNRIEQIYKQLLNKEPSEKLQFMRTLLIDVAAAAGTTSSTRFILDLMQSRELTEMRAASIWITMTNHIESPEIVRELVDFVQSMNPSESRFLSSAAFVSVATTVNRLCVDPSSAEYAVQKDLYGSKACNKEDVVGSLVAYLRTGIMVNLFPMREPYLVQALSNLASPNDTFDLLADIIEKKIPPTSGDSIRTLAVYALERRKMGDSMREKVFPLLMTVFDDLNETEELRQSAFITMITWEPDSSWWQRMAKQTWNENATNVDAFVYFTIKTLSETKSELMKSQANIASFVLPLAKPFPASRSKSYNLVFANYLNQENIDTRFHFEWIPNPVSNIPRQVYSHLSTSFGGVDFNLFEVALSLYDFNSYASLKESSTPSSDSSSEVPENIKKLAESLANYTSDKKEPTANLLLRAFDNLYAFVPFKIKDLYNAYQKDNMYTDDKELKWHNIVKFFKPSSSQLAIPTDFGLPIILEVSSSVLGFVNYSDTSDPCDETQRETVLPNPNCLRTIFDIRLSTKLSSTIKTYLPWSNETLQVGVDNSRKLHVPINVTYAVDQGDHHTYGILEFGPSLQKKFPILASKNVPYTAIKSILPGVEATNKSHTILYRSNSSLEQETLIFASKFANLNFSLNYAGDVALPLTPANFMDLFKTPDRILTWMASPSLKPWGFSFNFDPTTSRTKLVRLMYENALKTALPSDATHSRQNTPQEEPAKSSTYLSKRNLAKFISKRFPKVEESWPTLGKDRTVLGISLGFCSSIYTDFYANAFGVKLQYYVEKMTNQSKTLYSKLTFMRGYERNTDIQIPLEVIYEVDMPLAGTYESFFKALNTGMETKFKGNASLSPDSDNCTKLLSYEGSLNLSDTLRTRILQDLNNNCIRDGETFIEDLNTHLTYDVAYLNINYTQSKFSDEVMNYSYWLNDLAKGYYFPYYSSNHLNVSNKEDSIQISAKRILQAEGYDLFIKKPKEQISINRFRFPFGINSLFSFSELKKTFSMSRSEAMFCEIRMDNDTIRNSDGVLLDFPVNFCPLTVTMDDSPYASWIVFAQLDENHQINLSPISLLGQVYTVISKHDIKINGISENIVNGTLVIKDKDGHDVLIIDTTNRYKKVEFLYYFTIEIRENSFRIYPDQSMREHLKGVCGNFQDSVMMGPDGCVYNDTSLFAASWTTLIEEQQCKDQLWLLLLMKEVEEYRKGSCTRN